MTTSGLLVQQMDG